MEGCDEFTMLWSGEQQGWGRMVSSLTLPYNTFYLFISVLSSEQV